MSSSSWVMPFCIATLAAGFLSGCEAGSGEIPLAKVPPPPPGFGEPSKNAMKNIRPGIISPAVLPKYN
jgi:hypothetical protein